MFAMKIAPRVSAQVDFPWMSSDVDEMSTTPSRFVSTRISGLMAASEAAQLVRMFKAKYSNVGQFFIMCRQVKSLLHSNLLKEPLYRGKLTQ